MVTKEFAPRYPNIFRALGSDVEKYSRYLRNFLAMVNCVAEDRWAITEELGKCRAYLELIDEEGIKDGC